MSRSKAKTTILKWYDTGKVTQTERAHFSEDIDLFFNTISHREAWKESITTFLEDDGEIRFSISGKNWQAIPTPRGLAITSVVPGWAIGWSNVFKNEMSEDFFSWLAHYCRQYIHRSHICKVLMAAWEKNAIILHPFGKEQCIQRYTDSINNISSADILSASVTNLSLNKCSLDKTEKYRSKWISRNTLDPSIHQGVFHFLRGQELLKAGFDIEALVAFDCVIQSVQNRDWSWASGNPRQNRRDLCKALSFSVASQDLAEQVYFLRNQFGAHPGGWRWWDFGEYLEENICEKSAHLSNRVLRKTAEIEVKHRVLEPYPNNWSNWLENNFDTLWTAVWFKAR